MKRRTTTIAGTSILTALVIVFDYALKFSGWKIAFPWFPALKFDFTGIPITLSLLMYGLPAGVTTSTMAFLAIFLRSGDWLGASQKALAEFFTILGIALFIKSKDKFAKNIAVILGLALRVITTSLISLVVLPLYYPKFYPTLWAVALFLPLLAAFNIIAGSISILGGFLIYESLIKRMPAIISTNST